MKWITRLLMGVGIVVVLLVAIVVLVPSRPDVNVHQMEMTVGDHAITVKASYNDQVEQTEGAEGITLVVDGRKHHIDANGNQLVVDGKTHVLEPDQDAEVLIDETGAVAVRLSESDEDS